MKNFKPLHKIIFTILVGLFTLAISELVFNKLNLYYEIWWLDIPMHIFGGLLVSALYIYAYEYKNKSKKFSLPPFSTILFFVLAVAIVWEIHEYLRDLVDIRTWGGWRDTLSDIINAVIGLCMAYGAHKYFKGRDF